MTDEARPTVLVVMRSGEWRGGAEWMLWQLISHEQSQHVKWIVAFLEDGRLAQDVRQRGIDTCVLPAGRVRQVRHGAATVRALTRIMRERSVDLVIGWMADAHLYGAPAAALAGVPALWYQLWIPRPSWVDRLATALPARGVLACSDSIASAQRRVLPRRPVATVHPGVDLARFAPDVLPPAAEARRLLGLPEEGPLIGLIGRIERWKGTHVLVEALPGVLRSHPDARCVLVGSPHDRDPEYGRTVERRILELGLGDRVIMAGAQRRPELWMQACDVLVHASDAEPFGIVVVEYLALGKPVIAGSAGGPTEVITPGIHGLLTPYGDAVALARAIVQVLDDPAYAARLAEAGMSRAPDFSTERYVTTLLLRSQELTGVNGLVRSAL